ncbi:hypothetical protein [Neobacillus niacini]|uniref:hypothetical protein n=1 Tax=Neobacillus niacini TaxID=86668 RepID=UPI002855659B|nr:hypothetical protein [Neobacillus niacini]MDR6999443.1 hypothetical protein [Neobacillus niacini]
MKKILLKSFFAFTLLLSLTPNHLDKIANIYNYLSKKNDVNIFCDLPNQHSLIRDELNTFLN